MKWKPLFRYLTVGISSLASLFSGIGAHASPTFVKEMTKTGKKLRPAETRKGGTSATDGTLDSPRKPARQFPWKYAIVTTTFWIGEKPTPNNPVPNHKSSWDPQWAEHYGGTDTPDRNRRTSEYIPAGLTPRQNPFYIALPYNDKTAAGHKPEAATAIPWYQETYAGPEKSVCKGRWIAIRKGSKVCYAQWEDAGPFRTDHWQYVFGNERPKANLNGGAGLDVSPAVRDYLGMDDTDVTDWKFVEFADVPVGPWARFGDNNTFVQNRRTPGKLVARSASPLHLATIE